MTSESPDAVALPQLTSAIETYLDPDGQALVRKAAQTASEAHAGYRRLEGTPYLAHPVAVANILAGWRVPPRVLAVALLHDVLKEKYAAGLSPEDIEEAFGEEIARLVEHVASLGRLGPVYPAQRPDQVLDTMDHVAKRMPWVALTLQEEPLAGVVKIADRLHNFQSLHVLAEERQQAYAASTLNIFVPFADRLGIYAAKRRLEDAAFAILQPDKYAQIDGRYPPSQRARAAAEIVDLIQHRLDEAGLPARVQVQPNSHYALYQQQMEQKRQLPLHLAQPILILCENEADCYRALRPLHQIWAPQPGGVTDFVAAPKLNGYRALHTRVRYTPSELLLVLLRDRQMQLLAEYGLLAGWQGVPAEWLPQISSEDAPSADEIRVFTPDGEGLTLPNGATPVDFAYAVHSGLGHQCTGAEVNGRMVSLDQTLHHGDVVKILTSQARVGPARDWLNVVQTRRARSAIQRWFRDRDGAGTLPGQSQQGGGSGDEMPRLQANIRTLTKRALPKQLAQCCNPLPPDAIVGYVNRRNVVMIHLADCHQARQLRPLIKAEWDTINVEYQAAIKIVALDRPGLVRDVSAVISGTGINMISFHADRLADGSSHIEISLGDVPQVKLAQIDADLHDISGVRKVDMIAPNRPSRLIRSAVVARHFVNPYTLGPVTGHGFYGRQAELRELINNLRDMRPGEAVLLWGPRRIGKTSLLLEFQQNVMSHEDYVLAFVDMQPLSGGSTLIFLRDIMRAIAKALPDANLKRPSLHRLRRDPLEDFRNFLENEPGLQQKHLVLIFDEFQLLTQLAEEQVTLEDINRYFRSLIQHRRSLSVIFSGGGTLDMLLAHPAASFMLEVSRYQKVGCLDKQAARDLIVQPAPRVEYDASVIEALLAITARHPYYLQWLCGELVSRADAAERPLIQTQDLDELLSDWLPGQGEHFFNHLWGSSIGFNKQTLQENKLALTAVAQQARNNRRVSFDAVVEGSLSQALDRGAIWRTLQNLVQMDTLSAEGEWYQIKMALCEQWLQANYPIDRLVKEIQWAKDSS